MSSTEAASTADSKPASEPSAKQIDVANVATAPPLAAESAPADQKSVKRPKRRRSMSKKPTTSDAAAPDAAVPDVAAREVAVPDAVEVPKVVKEAVAPAADVAATAAPAKKSRRGGRSSRGKRSRPSSEALPATAMESDAESFATDRNDTLVAEAEDEAEAEMSEDAPSVQTSELAAVAPPPTGRRRSRRGRGRGRGRAAAAADENANRDVNEDSPVETINERKAPPAPITTAARPAAKPVAKTFPKVVAKIEKTEEREMLINVSAGDECRIAVLANGKLEELFIERASSASHVGNIYKGRITNIEPSIQAAFVDFGLPQKNGFLHISDVQPQYFPDHDGEAEEVGRKIPRHHRPPIQKCFRRGQEVIVQVTKEGVGTKGPTLTTYLSIPGRFLVMMPGMNRHGVSRKIEDEAERRSMRELLSELELPTGIGFILRTAGLGRTKRELQRDLNYLVRLWKTVAERIQRLPTPAELYQESDLVTRTIRDVYTADFSRVIVDDADTAKKAREFLLIAMPRARTDVELYSEREPLFHRYGIEAEIERINMRQVPLPSGGSLVIESTEALVAIDVNSGRSRINDDAEETAYAINIEAAEEIARQLRLRDLGGLIICDFIDMRQDRHKRGVERALRDALKKHKERARTLKLSSFGLIEMTRQRQGPSLKRNIYYDCPHCKGTGQVKMPDSVILDVMRIVQLAAHHEEVQRITVTVAADVAYQILNGKRTILSEIETDTGKQIVIRGDASYMTDRVECLCEDSRGRPIDAIPSPVDHMARSFPGRRPRRA